MKFLIVLFIVLFLFKMSHAQKIHNQIYYTISPDGIGEISFIEDTIISKKCFERTSYTEIQNKVFITDVKISNGYYYIIGETIFNKYTKTTTKKTVLVAGYSNDAQIIKFPVENIRYVKNQSFVNIKPDANFYFSGYSPALLKSFELLKKVDKLDSTEIKKVASLFHEKLVKESNKIKAANNYDPTGTVIFRELLNRSLLELKIDPNIREDKLFKIIGNYLK